MNIIELIESVQKKNILNKAEKTEMLLALHSLNAFGFETDLKNEKPRSSYLNRNAQNILTQIRAFAVHSRFLARQAAEKGMMSDAFFLNAGARMLSIVVTQTLDALGEKERKAVERSYKNHEIFVLSKDSYRMGENDRPDDENCMVGVDCLYELAFSAIETTCNGCDGLREECEHRDRYVNLRVPHSRNGSNCPYSQIEIQSTAVNAVLSDAKSGCGKTDTETPKNRKEGQKRKK